MPIKKQTPKKATKRKPIKRETEYVQVNIKLNEDEVKAINKAARGKHLYTFIKRAALKQAGYIN